MTPPWSGGRLTINHQTSSKIASLHMAVMTVNGPLLLDIASNDAGEPTITFSETKTVPYKTTEFDGYEINSCELAANSVSITTYTPMKTDTESDPTFADFLTDAQALHAEGKVNGGTGFPLHSEELQTPSANDKLQCDEVLSTPPTSTAGDSVNEYNIKENVSATPSEADLGDSKLSRLKRSLEVYAPILRPDGGLTITLKQAKNTTSGSRRNLFIKRAVINGVPHDTLIMAKTRPSKMIAIKDLKLRLTTSHRFTYAFKSVRSDSVTKGASEEQSKIENDAITYAHEMISKIFSV
jgi:hypothetical protein